MATTARHRALRSVLAEHAVSSQTDLVDLLAARGFDVTQATVSRDLQAVGAVKSRDSAGVLRYVVGNGSNGAEGEGILSRAMADYAMSIQASANLVVVKTPPGAAHVVGAAIDAVGVDGTIGTVAGDDTLLVIAADADGGAAVAAELERIGDGR